MQGPPKMIAPGDGKRFDVIGGDVVTIKLTGDESGGSLTVLETVTPPNGGPPLHVHRRESETFYVVDGQFEFYVGDQKFVAEAGAYVFAPKDVPHRFVNIGKQPAKLVVFVQPSGFEEFIGQLAEVVAAESFDPLEMLEVADKFGIEFYPGGDP